MTRGDWITSLLEKAYAQVAQLPEAERDNTACMILEEIEDEERWNQQFANIAAILAQLAQNALKEHRDGKTLTLDPEAL